MARLLLIFTSRLSLKALPLLILTIMNTRQLQILKAMGISFWQLKQTLTTDPNESSLGTPLRQLFILNYGQAPIFIIHTSQANVTPTALTEKSEQLFKSLLFALNLSSEEGNEVTLTSAQDLQEHLLANRPKAILCLGEAASEWLLANPSPLSELRGQIHHFQDFPWVASFDPADLVSEPKKKAEAYEDLQRLHQLLLN